MIANPINIHAFGEMLFFNGLPALSNILIAIDMNVGDRIKGFIGLTALTPIATTAISGIGTGFAGLSSGVKGIGSATATFASAGFMGGAIKASGAKNMFKW